MTNASGDSLHPDDDMIPIRGDSVRLARMGYTTHHQEEDLGEQVRSGYRGIRYTPLGEDKSTVYAMMHKEVLTREDQGHGFQFKDARGRNIRRPENYGSQGYEIKF